MNKALTSLVALVAIAVAFIAINIISTQTMRGARIDLTSNRLFTLSEGTRRIAGKLDEQVKLTLYFSEKQANDAPQYKTYGLRVKELLREYAAMSGGKIKLEEVDPEPFSEAEDTAAQAGLIGLPTGRGNDRLYFGLVGSGTTDKQQVIAFFDPAKEEFLEYDLSRLVYLLSNPKKKTVGLMSWLPLEGGQPNPMQRQPAPPWQIYAQMKELFEVKTVGTDATAIPADVGVLMVVHPKQMSEQTQYAIDQFVLKGGKVLLFVDPLCDVDVPPGVNPMQAMGIPKNSDAPRLLGAWGLELAPEMVVADRRTAIRVNAGSQQQPKAVDYLIWMNVGSKTGNLNASDQVTATLQTMILPTAGALNQKSTAGLTVTPLIESTTESMLVPVANVSFMPDPEKLVREFVAGGVKKILATRVTGKAKSAFPEGKPQPAPADPNNPEAPKPEPVADPMAGHVAESAEDIAVIVVTDCDMLNDRFWITEDRLFGQISMGYRKMSDNGDFVIGALDLLSGSNDLIGLRARGTAARPFELVEKIRHEAEEKFLQVSKDLEDKLRQTETKISELQKQRGVEDANSFILSPEQQAELEKFNKERTQIRKDLRDVQHQLSKDIEGLGTRLKIINIGVMPAAVALFAVGLGVYRRNRRTVERRRGSGG
ncbi:MAG: Gldg family protein [Phycisphaerales bacterium]|nr:Gldg family protein [Phycisphaerales bacterium]